MNVLGVRCSNRDFSYAVLTGTKALPSVICVETLSFPKNYSRVRSLLWCMQEIDQILGKHCIASIVMKRFEGRSRGGAFEERVEYEAAVYLAAAKRGVNDVSKKMNCTLAKDLGRKGRAHYLRTVETNLIAGFDAYSDKEQEAIFSGWSVLP